MSDEGKREHGDRLVDAYERMLGRAHERMEQAERGAVPAFRELIDRIKENMVELGELTREEANRVGEYVERDIRDAAAYIAETGEDLRKWWQFDLALVEQRMLDVFARVADQTSVQLSNLAEQARRTGTWRQGEVAGPGTLVCSDCGKTLTMTEAGRIPACPACGGSRFRRAAGPPGAGD